MTFFNFINKPRFENIFFDCKEHFGFAKTLAAKFGEEQHANIWVFAVNLTIAYSTHVFSSTNLFKTKKRKRVFLIWFVHYRFFTTNIASIAPTIAIATMIAIPVPKT